MKRYEYLYVTGLLIILSISSAIAQNTNQNQINNNVPHNNNSTIPTQNNNSNLNQDNNAGNINQDNIVNKPFTTVHSDSVNNGAGVIIEDVAPPKHDAMQQIQHVRNMSGQNQMVVPPNAARPDTSIIRITTNEKSRNAAETNEPVKDAKTINTTLTASPSDRDTIK